MSVKSVDESGDVELTGAVYRGTTEGGDPYEIAAEVAQERVDALSTLPRRQRFGSIQR